MRQFKIQKNNLLSLFSFQDLCSYESAMFRIECGPTGKDHMGRIIIPLSSLLGVVLMLQVTVFSANKCRSPIHVPDDLYP